MYLQINIYRFAKFTEIIIIVQVYDGAVAKKWSQKENTAKNGELNMIFMQGYTYPAPCMYKLLGRNDSDSGLCLNRTMHV